MPHTIDFAAAVQKEYETIPVPRNYIKSSGKAEAQILWVGCSDSLIVETETLDVRPEEMIVHRNFGDVVSNGDLSSMSAIEWAVDVLKVQHIIVCGHYDCSLIRARDGDALHGWHKNITKLHAHNERHLSTSYKTIDETTKARKLEEIHVLTQTDWLKRQECVKKVVEGRDLRIHAFVYDKSRNECVRLVEESERGFKGLKDGSIGL